MRRTARLGRFVVGGAIDPALRPVAIVSFGG
jgi:hypothetical protein